MRASIGVLVVVTILEGIKGGATEDVAGHKNIGLINGDICGQSSKLSPGGKLFQTPWMALLVYNGTRGTVYSCGGTIINDRYVLTAAHCVYKLPAHTKLVGVRLGEYDYSQPIDCEEVDGKRACAEPSEMVGIEQVIPHAEYSRKTFRHDIALLRLNSTVNFSPESVRPICLPAELDEQQRYFHDGELMTVVGWGIVNRGVQSSMVRTVHVEYVPTAVCAADYANLTRRVTIFDEQLCLRGTAKGDATSGDGGGPVVSGGFEHSDKVVQFGIVSFGPSAEVLTPPGVYTRVGSYIDWILNTIEPNGRNEETTA